MQVWNIAKWPVLLLFVSFMFAVLYWAAPNVKQPGFRWITPGGVLAVIGWVIASVAFAFYVGNFGSYNKTYGALAGPIVFLVWLWISNIMILLGAEFNAELERGRAIEEGMRPEDRSPSSSRATRARWRPTSRERGHGQARTDGALRRLRRAGQRPPFGSYAAFRALFNAGHGRRRGRRQGAATSCRSGSRPGDIVLTGVATHKLSRLIAKDKIMAFVRAPFTEYQEPGGPAEVEERARGRGLAAHGRRAARVPVLPRHVDLGRFQPRTGVAPRSTRLRGVGADRR